MTTKSLDNAIAKGLDFLVDVLKWEKKLCFPFLYAVTVWAAHRPGQWKEKVFSWEVWPDPEFVKTKSDEFILFFFNSRKDLEKEFHPEIQKGDINTLRAAFGCLYPVLGLEDPFLTGLFHDEILKGKVRELVARFPERTASARDAISAAGGRSRILEGLAFLGREAAALGKYMFGDEDIQDAILREIEKKANQ